MYSLNKTIKKENWSITDFIEYASRLSIDGVELLDMYWKDKEKDIKEVNAALQRFNIPVSAYAVTNNFVKETSFERAEEVAKVEEGIQIAKQLGTNIVRIFCGDLHENLSYEDAKSWIVKSIQQAAKSAEKEQVFLAIENHGLIAGKSEQIKEIIKKVNSPYVKSTFDTGNFLLVHEKPQHAFDILIDDIVHVHFKDFRLKEANETLKAFHTTKGAELIGAIPGDGEVDLPIIVNRLQSMNYNGWLSIEYEGYDDAVTSSEEAVRSLQDLLKK